MLRMYMVIAYCLLSEMKSSIACMRMPVHAYVWDISMSARIRILYSNDGTDLACQLPQLPLQSPSCLRITDWCQCQAHIQYIYAYIPLKMLLWLVGWFRCNWCWFVGDSSFPRLVIVINKLSPQQAQEWDGHAAGCLLSNKCGRLNNL